MFRRSLLRALALACCSLALAACPVLAAEGAAPGWRVESLAKGPSNLPPGGYGYVEFHIYNDGAAPSSGTVTLTDELPTGITYTGVQPIYADSQEAEPWRCTGTQVVTCTSETTIFGSQPVLLDLRVHVEAGLSGELHNHVTVGGGSSSVVASADNLLPVSSAKPRFGIRDYEMWASSANGTADTQAGSHPYELTTAFDLNTVQEQAQAEGGTEGTQPAGEAENITVDLPPGIVGDPTAVPQCPRVIFDVESCPADTQVGVDTVSIGDLQPLRFEVYNIVPPPGVPAQLAFELVGLRTYLNTTVRTGGDYGLVENVDHVVQKEITFNELTVWGVPSDPSHNPERCGAIGTGKVCDQYGPNPTAETAFLTLPSSCGAQLNTSVSMNSWQDESDVQEASAVFQDNLGAPLQLEGCQKLSLRPTMTVSPESRAADTPTGLTVDVKVPQEGLLTGKSLVPADIQNTTVTLPQGIVVNPGQASGLQACGESQDGLTTEAERREGKEDTGPPSCPNASKVGTVSIQSPLIENAAEKEFLGNVYILPSNPPELKLLVAASADGVNVKLVGTVHLNEQTGQLQTTFLGTPELPFDDLKLAFSGGAQAALATPTHCGTYTSNADFNPWSSPFSPDALAESSFPIESGTGGAPCPAATLPFTPSLIAGATTDQAGGYTSFSLLLRTPDDQQRIKSLQFKVPEGLLGMISRVQLCGEPQASQGTCPAASQIGHTVVASGPGPYPLQVPEPGRPPAPIYLTGGYGGAPYGLSIVVPVEVGPFNLGTVVVRAKIEVDPHTAQLTVTTDPFPQVLHGVPTDLRTIDAVIDRPEFMFNPTNCEPQSFAGTATSAEGNQAPISSHFQMGSCRALKFQPNFKVSTSGKTSRANGASLTAKIVYPTGPLGANQASSQSNIRYVKVELPKKLPSRLTTLQKACTAQVFEANPANCPQASVVGHARALTPVLPVPLTGPAYFVSHGNEAFPSLIVVLQGYGVTVDLVGSTFISKQGITSSTFKQVPDVPIGLFELVLPEGPYSALAANGDLCDTKLKMPTHFIAQDGAALNQITPITTTGCKRKTHQASRRRRRTARPNRKSTQL